MSGEIVWKRRVLAARVIYGVAVAVVLAIASLGMDAYLVDLRGFDEGESEPAESMLSLFGVVFTELLDPELFRVKSMDALWEALTVFGLAFTYSFCLPSGLLLWLGGYQKVFLWSGRVLWSMLIVVGPVALLVMFADANTDFELDVELRAGLLSWVVWAPLMASAFWVTRTRKDGALLVDEEVAIGAGADA